MDADTPSRPAAGGIRGLPARLVARAGRRWTPRARDVLLAIAVAAVQLAAVVLIDVHSTTGRPLDLLGRALPVVSGLALVARRRYPLTTYGVALVATATWFARDYDGGPIFWSMIIAIVTLVLAGRRRDAIAASAVGYVTFLVIVWSESETAPWGFVLGVAAWLIALLTGAEAARARRERAAEQARSRDEEARRRVTEERLRIARELHDVVAHNISLVNLQAGVALHLLDQQPEQARTALATIKDASKEALVELRSVLGVLRQVDEPDDAPRAPTPGLARLPDVVAQSEAAGVDVRVVTVGNARPLPAGLDLAAFRIVQEALTNVARHAGPTTAEVRITYRDDALVVEVTDDGRAHPGSATTADPSLGSGHGLAGMRERAEAVGGEVEAGPRPGFGWRVRARLPLDAPAPDPASDPALPPDVPAPDPVPPPNGTGATSQPARGGTA